MSTTMITEFKFADREEWLAIRSHYIGGSDAASVIGLNPYKSAYTLWAEKTGRMAEFSGNVTTKVGAYLEQLVADMFEEETGKKVRRKNATMVNDLYPFACANIDRLIVGEKALLEIKTTNSLPLMRKLRNSSEFPENYYCQMMHYLAVTELPKAYLAVLINCRELKIYELERDEDEINALMTAEKEFWRYVETDTAPSPDGSESTGDAIAELYPDSNGETVQLFGFDEVLDEYCEIGEQIKALQLRKDEAANKIKDYLKDAEKGESDRYRVSFATQTRKSFDAKRFAAEHSEIPLDGYYKVSNSRMFRVNTIDN